MCLAPSSYDLVTHKTYLMKVMKKYSIDLMELSFEVKENMSEGDYLWVTKFIKFHYDGSISYLNKPDYMIDTAPKEALEKQVDNLLGVIEFLKEIWDAFTRSAAIVEAGGKSSINWKEGQGAIISTL